MSWTRAKPNEKLKVEPKKRVWITGVLQKLGRKPTVVQEEEDDFSGTNPFYQDGGEGSSSGSNARPIDRAELIQQLLGTDENIKREKKIGISLDLGYRKDVKKPVDEFLKKTGKLFAEGSTGELKAEHLKDVFKLRDTLVEAGEGYEERGDDQSSSDQMRSQRGRKANAITERVDALDDLAGLTPKGLAQWLIPTEAPEDERFGKMAVKDTEELTERAVGLLIENEGKLNAMLGDMVGRQIANETQGKNVQEAKKNLMRSNTALSKAIQQVLRQHKESREFCEAYQENIVGLFGEDANELDPFKIKGDEQAKQSAASDAADRLADIVVGVLKQTMGKGLPGPIEEAARAVAEQARKAGFDDDRDVAIAVGGVVMLRVLVPQITALVPKLGANGKRTVIIVSKAVQDVANGTLDKAKEPYMIPLYRKLQAWEQPLFSWMLRIAEG